MRVTTGKFKPLDGGWVRWAQSDLPPIFVRFTINEAGRAVVADTFVPFADPPDSRTWRRIGLAMSDVEAFANEPDELDGLRASMDLPAPLLRTAISHAGTSFGSRSRDTWVTRMLASQVEGSDEPSVKPKRGMLDVEADRFEVDLEVPDLEVPSTRPYPDGFYRRIADVYADLARFTRKPAAVLADETGTPVKTVHRWVAEARKRGHLAPGRTGRAG